MFGPSLPHLERLGACLVWVAVVALIAIIAACVWVVSH